MSTLPIAALAGLLTAAAIAALSMGLRPRRRSLAEVRAILQQPTRSRPDTAARTGDSARHRIRPFAPERLGDLIAGGPVGTSVGRRLGSGLALTDRTITDVISQVLVGAVITTFATVLALGTAVAAGWIPWSPVQVVLVVIVAAASATFMWSDACSRVERARREFRRAANDFVQLTAVGLTTDQSVEESISFALTVGDSAMFTRLRDALASGPARGIPIWDVLDDLGHRHEVRELSELASSIERQGLQGVSITETVTTLAATMRSRALDELERDAERANANLAGPTIGFVVATIVFLGYPLAIRIGDAFGR